ncbi:MAG: PQQ-binding-like beta-propeller repeat protein, partial [Planctomycetes bacterium]|nr:PQQ-binding-like beta-propeller repeat protein [Planctomycetota bacterium]
MSPAAYPRRSAVRSFLLATVAVAAAVAAALPAPARGAQADELLKRLGGPRGIWVLVGDKQCVLARDLAAKSDLTLLVQVPGGDDLAAACRAADEAGLYGTRIFVARAGAGGIPLADNVADAVVSPDAAGAKAEVLRVLRPQGKALLGRDEVTKPVPDGVDDWSHHYHGPDNNPQSADQLARAPYLTQFVVEPRYGPAPQAAVASGGRFFMAFGHVAWHPREEPMLNTLLAVNGYNGTLLWRKPLRQGNMVDRCTMIATPDVLYLGGADACERLDAATGEVLGRITVPADLSDGPFWKWMGMDGGVLYALVGREEKQDPDAKWGNTGHGWPWDAISKGYNQDEYAWGFAPTLFAIDPKSGKVLWHHREAKPIDSRGVCMKGGRIYICRFGEYIACLDAATGKEMWRRTADKDAGVFEAIGPYRPEHGYVGGWKSTVFLKCTDKSLYFIGPQVQWLTALAADDGRFLWKYPGKDLQVVIRDDALYTISPEGDTTHTKKLDPLAGTVLAEYPVHRRACTRSTGASDGILFRSQDGSQRLDLASGKQQYISTMRPSCHVGVVTAAGHLYWVPWACDCNLQMFGVISCGPAGNFAFDAPAADGDRLETAAGPADVAPLEVSPADWPAYRAGNRRQARTAAPIPAKADLLWTFTPTGKAEATAPVAAGGLVFTAGADGIVRALDAATGRPRWTAYTGGAVRYPPAIADGRAFVGSGDGWAYAFEAATGRRLWRFRAAPIERKISVYGALVSTWPVTGGIVVHDGTAYLAAGINNFDGTHVYALDAASGRIKWQNNTCGHLDPFSRRGVAAQGDMLIHDGKLYLAGGNSVSPAAFDLATGRCLNAPPERPGTTATRGRELRVSKEGVVEVYGQPLYSVPGATVFDKSTNWDPPLVAAAGANLVLRQPKGGGAAWAIVAQDPQT